MFRKLFAHIRTGFLLEFAYPISFLFFLILPLAFTGAVSAGLSGMMSGAEDAPRTYKTWIAVYSEDKSFLVDALLETMAANDLDPQLVDELPEDAFALEIPANFSERLLAGQSVNLTLHIRPTSSASEAVEQYVRAAAGRVGGAAMVAQMGLDQAREGGRVDGDAEESAYFETLLQDTLSASEDPIATTRLDWAGQVNVTADRSSPTSTEQASAGQIVTWTQITFLAAAEVFVTERENGTLRRLLASRSSRALTLTGKLLSRLLLGLVQMTVLFVGGALIFGVQWSRDPLALIAVSLAFALATVGLGMLLATLVKTRGQASSVVVGLAMGLSALGGAWYPMEITPPLYQKLVQVLPSTWAMRAYTDLLVRGAGLRDIMPAVGILLAFAAVFITLGVLRFGKLEQRN
ncbi:ABC transporter permease [bacterium]|nr:ABC transporter permease [bacterium]